MTASLLLSLLKKYSFFFLVLQRPWSVDGRKNYQDHRPSFLLPPFSRIPYRGGGEGVTTTTITPVITTKEEEEVSSNTTTTTTTSNTTTTTSTSNYTFSLFQEGDGSEEDADHIPLRYLRMQKGNREKAGAALQQTVEWRKEHDVDTILARPHTLFDSCKNFQPHFFLGCDTTDHIIFVQRPGFTKFELLPSMKPEDLLLHYCYIMEYCWNILNTKTNTNITTMTAILDLAKVKLSNARDMLYFIRQYVSMMSHHYPQRSYKTLIINAPTWFSMIFSVIQPLLRDSTKQKITILAGGTKQRQAMQELLGDAIVDDGLLNGNEYTDWNQLPMERELREFCVARLEEHGKEMQPFPSIIIPPKKSFFSMKK